MKVKDLIEKLKDKEDFDIEFVFSDSPNNESYFLNIRTFKDVYIADIGYSDKFVLLSGEER